jgi:sugar phosphate permease
MQPTQIFTNECSRLAVPLVSRPEVPKEMAWHGQLFTIALEILLVHFAMLVMTRNDPKREGRSPVESLVPNTVDSTGH